MQKKWFIIIALIVTLGLLSILAMPEENRETLASDLPRDIAAVAKGKVDLEGGIIQVAAPRQGIVTQVTVTEGHRVKKGQILAQMDDRQPQLTLDVINSDLNREYAELHRLQLLLSQAKRDLDRMKSLEASSAVSRQRYDNAKDKYTNIDAETKLQQANIEKIHRERDVQEYEVSQYTIRAPQDGLIVRRMAQPGQGTSTLDVTDLFLLLPDEERIIRAEVEERFVDSLRLGMDVTIEPQGGELPKRRGTIRRIGKIMGTRKNTVLDPTDKVDVRVVEVVVSFAQTDKPMIIGQRVIVRFKGASASLESAD